MKGKLIVIDGIDGSGKATQTKLLAARLKQAGYKVKTIDFPRYYDNFFGKLIGECLAGKRGDFIELDPCIVSTLYAADRFESSKTIRSWLDKDYVVITDRYVSSNQIHQGGKIVNLKERREFMKWLDVMEHTIFGIPKPDRIIYLDVPFEVSRAWLESKVLQRDKKYLQGKKDLAESNLRHLKVSRDSAVLLSKESKNWTRIACCKGKVCMLPEAVSDVVFEEVSKILKKR